MTPSDDAKTARDIIGAWHMAGEPDLESRITAALKAAREEGRAAQQEDGYLRWGTDDCKQCRDGRVSLYARRRGVCIECDHAIRARGERP